MKFPKIMFVLNVVFAPILISRGIMEAERDNLILGCCLILIGLINTHTAIGLLFKITKP